MRVEGATGFYGKLPALGDFVQRGLPREFTVPWDEWLARAVAESRAQLGESWLDVYLTSPLWRFVLTAGTCGPNAWAGVLMPSVDRVGRYFPLTVASRVPAHCDPFATVAAAEPWFTAVETLMLGVLDAEELDLDDFAAECDAVGLPSAPPADGAPAERLVDGWRVTCDSGAPSAGAVAGALVRGLLPDTSLWFNAGTAQAAPVLLAYAGLPPADLYLHLLLGGQDDGAGAAPLLGD